MCVCMRIVSHKNNDNKKTTKTSENCAWIIMLMEYNNQKRLLIKFERNDVKWAPAYVWERERANKALGIFRELWWYFKRSTLYKILSLSRIYTNTPIIFFMRFSFVRMNSKYTKKLKDFILYSVLFCMSFVFFLFLFVRILGCWAPMYIYKSKEKIIFEHLGIDSHFLVDVLVKNWNNEQKFGSNE